MNYRKLLIIAAIAVVAVLAVVLIPSMMNDENEANATASISLKKGQSWEWTPTFPSGLSPTLTVSGSTSSMPADSATFSTTSGNASISNGKLTITIPSDYSGSKYYVKLKAATVNPTQVIYYEITVNILTASVSYDTSTVHANVGSAISNMTPTVSGATASSYAISPSLPSGMNFNTSTGVISGTPTAYKAQQNYTVTATLSTTPSQTVTTTVSIGAFTNITSTSYTVYAIKGSTAISVPGTSMPTGTSLDSMSLTAKKDNTTVSVTAGTAYKGMTVAANTGAVSGTPTETGTYVFTETYTATAATGGSTSTRTITVYVEDQVTLSGTSAYSYAGHSDSATVTKTAGPNVTWTITSITKNGTAITSGTDFSAFTQSSGVVTCGTGATAGTYMVTLKATSSSGKTTSSGATGTSSTSNYATATATFTVTAAIGINNSSSLNFYMTESKIYDSLTLGSNVTGATWTVDSYGTGITNSNITVGSSGSVTAGSTALTAGSYTLTVKATDPHNATNTATATLNVTVVPALVFKNTPTAGQLAN